MPVDCQMFFYLFPGSGDVLQISPDPAALGHGCRNYGPQDDGNQHHGELVQVKNPEISAQRHSYCSHSQACGEKQGGEEGCPWDPSLVEVIKAQEFGEELYSQEAEDQA